MAESTSSEQARIEDDLQRTRDRMDRRLSELQERLTPGQLLDDAVGYLRRSGGADFARNLMTSVQNNPLPTLVTGIGLAWLMVSGTQPPAPAGRAGAGRAAAGDDLESRLRAAEGRVVRMAEETEDAYRERREEARATALGLAREAQETAEAFGRRIEDAAAAARRGVHDLRDMASATAGQVGSGAQYAGEQVARGAGAAREAGQATLAAVSDNPLLLGGLGVAVGALLGALVPQSEREGAALGEVADEVKEAAGEVAQQAMERGSEVADRALEAGMETARDAMRSRDEVLAQEGDARPPAQPDTAPPLPRVG